MRSSLVPTSHFLYSSLNPELLVLVFSRKDTADHVLLLQMRNIGAEKILTKAQERYLMKNAKSYASAFRRSDVARRTFVMRIAENFLKAWPVAAITETEDEDMRKYLIRHLECVCIPFLDTLKQSLPDMLRS